MIVQVFDKADFNEIADGPLFTGDVRRCRITSESNATEKALGIVRFGAGSRTAWHTHDFEQALVVVEGRGLVGTRDGQHFVTPGDVVFIEAGELHFHGGTETTSMSHVAISGFGLTVPGDYVSAQELRDDPSLPERSDT